MAIIWGILASAVCVLLPLWEARQTFYNVAVAVCTCAPPASQTPPRADSSSIKGRGDASMDASQDSMSKSAPK